MATTTMHTPPHSSSASDVATAPLASQQVEEGA